MLLKWGYLETVQKASIHGVGAGANLDTALTLSMLPSGLSVMHWGHSKHLHTDDSLVQEMTCQPHAAVG